MDDRSRPPDWLSIDANSQGIAAKVIRIPERRDIELPLNEQLIVEYYSR
jgi:small subunit ribosomal protein S4